MEEKLKTVLITGASSGIGEALVKIFVRNKYNVIGVARREQRLSELKQTLKPNDKYFDFFTIDVSQKSEIEKFTEEINSKYSVECLINNAGVSSFKKALDDSLYDIENVINTNLLGPIYLIKKILPQMVENKSGVIINVLSVVNKKIFTNSSIYSASKVGLEAYVNVLREEHRNDNIKIINVFPGATSTEIWPLKTLEKFSSKMMNPIDVAELIFNSYMQSKNISIEELVIRPITGDL